MKLIKLTEGLSQAEKADHEFEIKNRRRIRNEDKAWARFCKRSEKAETMVGELVRDGKTVHYVWPPGGKYREGSRVDLIEFLLRNHYV